MIVLDTLEQGSRAWVEARLGVVTASEVDKIVTAGGKLSSQRHKYMANLLVERLTGEPVEEFKGSDWVERGKVLEPKARAFYEFTTGHEVSEVGFIYRDEDKLCGASPDGMLQRSNSVTAPFDGSLELKCPAPHTHMLYWLDSKDGFKRYYPQMQFQLWVTGLEFADFLSWHPDLPPVLVRTEPEARFQDAFEEHIPTFLGEMREALATLKDEGYAPEVIA